MKTNVREKPGKSNETLADKKKLKLGNTEDRHFVTALARGLEVLNCFQSGELQLGNQDIAFRCGLPKSTVSRLTMTLTRLGYLIQVPNTGKYRLGISSLLLGTAMLSRLDVRQVARPLMQELADFAGGTVSLGACNKNEMIYIEHCRAQATLTISVDIGSRFPITTSAIGRAYLAGLKDLERQALLSTLQSSTKYTQRDHHSGIDRAVKDHKRIGVTCSFGEWQKDVNGIARALDPGGGLPIMAMSCTGLASRLSKDFLLKEVRPRLIEMTEYIERMLIR